VGRNIIDDALCGYNSTVLAYGQTGSGKTFTMFGKENIDIMNDLKNGFMENVGIIPRVAKEIFKKI
jgi:kinesin family protein 15